MGAYPKRYEAHFLNKRKQKWVTGNRPSNRDGKTFQLKEPLAEYIAGTVKYNQQRKHHGRDDNDCGHKQISRSFVLNGLSSERSLYLRSNVI